MQAATHRGLPPSSGSSLPLADWAVQCKVKDKSATWRADDPATPQRKHCASPLRSSAPSQDTTDLGGSSAGFCSPPRAPESLASDPAPEGSSHQTDCRQNQAPLGGGRRETAEPPDDPIYTTSNAAVWQSTPPPVAFADYFRSTIREEIERILDARERHGPPAHAPRQQPRTAYSPPRPDLSALSHDAYNPPRPDLSALSHEPLAFPENDAATEERNDDDAEQVSVQDACFQMSNKLELVESLFVMVKNLVNYHAPSHFSSLLMQNTRIKDRRL
uniref:Uncharacterized protein n=1 Tax=Sphaerodactylus townsendi TaxID=933632 RepID=A0ACB8G5P7_9SAUR